MTLDDAVRARDLRATTPSWWALLGSSDLHWGAAERDRFGPIVTACGKRLTTSHAIKGGSGLTPDFLVGATIGDGATRRYRESLNTASVCDACRTVRNAM